MLSAKAKAELTNGKLFTMALPPSPPTRIAITAQAMYPARPAIVTRSSLLNLILSRASLIWLIAPAKIIPATAPVKCKGVGPEAGAGVGVGVGEGVGVGVGVGTGVKVGVGGGTTVAKMAGWFSWTVTTILVDLVAERLEAVISNWPVRSKVKETSAMPFTVVTSRRGSSRDSAG
jgi:hypothetical protein